MAKTALALALFRGLAAKNKPELSSVRAPVLAWLVGRALDWTRAQVRNFGLGSGFSPSDAQRLVHELCR